MLDAWGKTQSGIFSGNMVSIGDFDQCIAVKHKIVSNNEFEGQYCLTKMLVNITAMNRPFDKFHINAGNMDADQPERRIPG